MKSSPLTTSVILLFLLGCTSQPIVPPHPASSPLLALSLAHGELPQRATTPGPLIQVAPFQDKRDVKDKVQIGILLHAYAPGAHQLLASDEPVETLFSKSFVDALQKSGYTAQKQKLLQPVDSPVLTGEVTKFWMRRHIFRGTYSAAIDVQLHPALNTPAVWTNHFEAELAVNFAPVGWTAVKAEYDRGFSNIITQVLTQAVDSFTSQSFRQALTPHP